MESEKIIFDKSTNSLTQLAKIKSSLSSKNNLNNRLIYERPKIDSSEINKKISSQIIDLEKYASSGSMKFFERLSTKELIPVRKYDNDTLQEIEIRRKTMYVSQSDFFKSTEEIFERGSRYNSIDRHSRRLSDNTQASGSSNHHPRLSDNIPVHSMHFDLPPSDELSIDEADFYANILDKILEELELIRFIIPADIDDEWDENYKSVDSKYDNYDEENCKNLLEPIISVAEKLQKDRTYACNVIKELIKDLKIQRRYDRLEIEIENIAKTMEGEYNLHVNNEIWSEQLEQLKKLIETDKYNHEILVNNLIIAIRDSAVGIDDALFTNNSKFSYMEKWEKMRLDGQKYRLELKEQKLQNELSKVEQMENVDEIISSQMREFIERDIARLEEESISWLKKYNDTMDKRQQEIELTREEIEKALEDLEIKENIKNIRGKFVDVCQEQRRIIAENNEYWKSVNEAAVIVQALWKGIMVRKQLGQYKGLWKSLKKRKLLAAKKRKKLEARRKKLEAKKADKENKKRK